MEEDDRNMNQFLADIHALKATDMTDIQQKTRPSVGAPSIEFAGAFPSSAPSECVREWGMSCPKCYGQNARPFMSWTISGRKMTLPQLRMWACKNPDCLHKWPRESSD
jgi:hypothetical protein